MTHQRPAQLAIATAQLNPVMGDVTGNLELAKQTISDAARAGADLVLFSELFLSGYPPEDLAARPALVETCRRTLDELVDFSRTQGAGAVIGLPYRDNGQLFNAVAAIDRGTLLGLRYKVELPNYAEFDEKRIFSAGGLPGPVRFRGIQLGLPICEDCWIPDVCECLAENGAEMLLVANGSPWCRAKMERRLQAMLARVVETALPLIYCNQTGGQDELVFDGGSFALDAERYLVARAPLFADSLDLTCWQYEAGKWHPSRAGGPGRAALLHEAYDEMELTWSAMVTGLRDYVHKNGFGGALLGLSGGIDSAVCAAVAVDALGPRHVRALMAPYRFTSAESREDARQIARLLKIDLDTIDIKAPVAGFADALGNRLDGAGRGVALENLQSRTRGALLMALSNLTGDLLITTGNKSELSVGYATLYGDMNGGFNPIKDLYKSEVFQIARWRNRARLPGLKGPDGAVIPARTIEKPPSAELRENQKDEDSLPPYAILDDILKSLIEDECDLSRIIARGHDEALVKRVENMLYLAEYKRRQSAPGVRISSRNFGRDRRYPITNRFRDRLPGPG